MRGTEFHRDFVLQSENFFISINNSYLSFVVGLRGTDWAFEGRRLR
jgi:hypothetical protein